MRIALVCRRYHPEIGGVETHVREIAERLAKTNDVTVFTLVESQTLAGNEVVNGVNVRRFKSLRLSYSLEYPLFQVGRAIEEFRPDVIHAHNIHTAIPYFASCIKSGSAFVVTPHYQGNALTTFRRLVFGTFKPYFNKALIDAESIICVSASEKEMLEGVFPSCVGKTSVIPNGVDPELLKIRSQGDGRRILSVARLDLYQKKTDKIIRAFNLVRSQDVDAKLVLVGNGPDKEKIRRLIESLGLSKDVEMKSNLERAQLIQEYANASVFATASENEAFGIAVAEALAANLRVIVPNSGGLSMYVKDGYATGIDPPITPEKLAEAMIARLKEKDRKLITYSPYTWDMVVAEHEKLYRDLLARRNLIKMRNTRKVKDSW